MCIFMCTCVFAFLSGCCINTSLSVSIHSGRADWRGGERGGELHLTMCGETRHQRGAWRWCNTTLWLPRPEAKQLAPQVRQTAVIPHQSLKGIRPVLSAAGLAVTHWDSQSNGGKGGVLMPLSHPAQWKTWIFRKPLVKISIYRNYLWFRCWRVPNRCVKCHSVRAFGHGVCKPDRQTHSHRRTEGLMHREK